MIRSLSSLANHGREVNALYNHFPGLGGYWELEHRVARRGGQPWAVLFNALSVERVRRRDNCFPMGRYAAVGCTSAARRKPRPPGVSPCRLRAAIRSPFEGADREVAQGH